MTEKKTTQTGVNGLTLLTILFIGLKLTGYIDWSWWWVLAPTWAPLAIALAVLVVCWTILAILGPVKEWLER